MASVKELIRHFLGFSFVGGLSTLASVVLICLMNEVFGWHPYCSYVVSYVLTILFSYVANAAWVYRKPLRLLALCQFFLTYLSGMFGGILLLALLRHVFCGVNDTMLSCAVIPVTVLWNFIFVNWILGQKGVSIK